MKKKKLKLYLTMHTCKNDIIKTIEASIASHRIAPGMYVCVSMNASNIVKKWLFFACLIYGNNNKNSIQPW